MREAAIPVSGGRVFAEMHDAVEVDFVYLTFGVELAETEYLPFGGIPVLCTVLFYADVKLFEQFFSRLCRCFPAGLAVHRW